MTVIAWDGKTLAADKRASLGGYFFTSRKIYRIGDMLVGFSGASDRIGAFRIWLEAGADPAAYPANPADDSTFMLVIHRDGRVERFEDLPWPIPVEERYFSTGSGRDYARAAMHLGCTAAEACAIASLFDEGCGNGVDTLEFEDAP